MTSSIVDSNGDPPLQKRCHAVDACQNRAGEWRSRLSGDPAACAGVRPAHPSFVGTLWRRELLDWDQRTPGDRLCLPFARRTATHDPQMLFEPGSLGVVR